MTLTVMNEKSENNVTNLKSLMCNSYILMSEKESSSGFSLANSLQPSGFKLSQSILTNKVRFPSDEILIEGDY